MNKSILFLVFLFCANIFFSQKLTPKDILLKSKEACEKVKSASFDSEMHFKFFNHKDTTLLSGRLNLLKLDTNESGVVGRMSKNKGTQILLFTNQSVYIKKNNIYIDTIDYKRGFEGNIHDELFNINFIKLLPFKVLEEKSNKYEFMDTSNSTFTIGVKIKDRKEVDNNYSVYCIDKMTMLPVKFTNTMHEKKQDIIQYSQVTITNLSINDDSANYYLNHFNAKDFDTVKYAERYITPKLLDSNTFAPDWKFPVYGVNDSVSLSQFKGKYVLMDFSYISCYPCMKAVPAMVDLTKRNKDKLVVLWINPFDNDEKLKDFVSKNKVNYPIVKIQRSFADTYHVSGYPTMYLINPEGKIKFIHVGFGYDKEYQKKFVTRIEKLIKE